VDCSSVQWNEQDVYSFVRKHHSDLQRQQQGDFYMQSFHTSVLLNFSLQSSVVYTLHDLFSHDWLLGCFENCYLHLIVTQCALHSCTLIEKLVNFVYLLFSMSLRYLYLLRKLISVVPKLLNITPRMFVVQWQRNDTYGSCARPNLITS